jgi:multidrug transporter EmrE-like cation transporter
MIPWLSLFFTLLAYSLISIGFVLMKKGISWINTKGKKDKSYYKNLLTWIIGFLVLNSSIVPNTIALKDLEPHIVSAFAGWGVIVLVFLSSMVLKEKIYKSDFIFTLVIFVSILLLNIFEPKKDQTTVQIPYFISVSVLPFFILAPAFFKKASRRLKTILFASVSGISTGMIIVSVKALVTFSGFHVKLYFSSPYFYIYLFFSLAAFLTLQVSYKLGHMMLVGPVQYSTSIIYPALCSFFVFENHITMIQTASLLLIIFGTANIMKRH